MGSALEACGKCLEKCLGTVWKYVGSVWEVSGKCLGNVWEVRGKCWWKLFESVWNAELRANTCKTPPEDVLRKLKVVKRPRADLNRDRWIQSPEC